MPQEFKPCPNLDLNEKACPCPYTDCARHGICCQCVANHRKSGDLPLCFRKKG